MVAEHPVIAEDATALAAELVRLRIVAADQLPDGPGESPAGLVEALLGCRVLTPFQADRVLAGDARSLALGPYRLLGVHATGTIGPTFRATIAGRDRSRPMVVRLLPLRSLWECRRAKQLARSLAAVAHPVVLPLADADSANGYHYLVWPFDDGDRLADRVGETGTLGSAAVAVLLGHLSAGLAACHARGFVHGLLTPHSVGLPTDPGGLPRLLEFGAGALLASSFGPGESIFDTITRSIAIGGLAGFAAPEWIADPTRLVPSVDQYGLGAVAYFALTGQAPTGEPLTALNPDVPAELATAIERLLEPDPAERFVDMTEAREVFAALAGHPELVDHLFSRSDEPSRRDSASNALPDEAEGTIHFDLPNGSPADDPVVPFEPPPPPVRTVEPPGARMNHPERPSEEFRPEYDDEVPDPYSTEEGSWAGEDSSVPTLPALPTPGVGRASPSDGVSPQSAATEPPKADVSGWKRWASKVRFWSLAKETVRVSVFAPCAVTPSTTHRVAVFLYPQSAARRVATLAQAFHNDAVHLATAEVVQSISGGQHLTVHLALAHMEIATPLGEFDWQGQPHRFSFDVVIPWEAPSGPAIGVISVGRNDVRIGKVEFSLQVYGGSNRAGDSRIDRPAHSAQCPH